MWKKLISISVILFILIFHKFIIFKIAVTAFEKWIKKEIIIKEFQILYTKNEIILNEVKVIGNEKNTSANVFSAEKIELKINPRSLFSKLIIIKNLKITKPKMNIFFEISNNEKEIIDDNIGILSNLKNRENPKIYPKKLIDINFLVINTKLDQFRVFIFKSGEKDKISLELSEIDFAPFGNEQGYQHYKEVFKIILTDIIMKIPDDEFKQKILRKYKIN